MRTVLKFGVLLALALGYSTQVQALITRDELDDQDNGIRANLRAYHGLTSVLQTDETADDYGGYGYNGVANFFMVADQRSLEPGFHGEPRILWYAVARFVPSQMPWHTTKVTNVFWSRLRMSLHFNEETYRRVYGDFGVGINRNLIVDGHQVFNLDDTLGTSREILYRQRALFRWPIEDRPAAPHLPADINPLETEAGFTQHATLQDFVAHLLSLRTNRVGQHLFLPHYSLSGTAWKCDALNCVSFGLRVLTQLGVAGLNNDDVLRRYLQYEYAQTHWSVSGLSYIRYAAYDGPWHAKPGRVIKYLFRRFVGQEPRELRGQHPRPPLAPFVGDLDLLAVNFPKAFSYWNW